MGLGEKIANNWKPLTIVGAGVAAAGLIGLGATKGCGGSDAPTTAEVQSEEIARLQEELAEERSLRGAAEQGQADAESELAGKEAELEKHTERTRKMAIDAGDPHTPDLEDDERECDAEKAARLELVNAAINKNWQAAQRNYNSIRTGYTGTRHIDLKDLSGQEIEFECANNEGRTIYYVPGVDQPDARGEQMLFARLGTILQEDKDADTGLALEDGEEKIIITDQGFQMLREDEAGMAGIIGALRTCAMMPAFERDECRYGTGTSLNNYPGGNYSLVAQAIEDSYRR